MLPPLLRKAAGDAGFDLTLGPDAEWERLGVSGLAGSVWVLPDRAGALLAFESRDVLREFLSVTWTDAPLPAAAAGAVRCASPADLYHTMRLVRVLLDQMPPRPEQRFQAKLEEINSTEAEAVVRRRVGQGLFREMMMDYWEDKCAVTGLAVPELLRASHAKPWKDSTDAERLDVHNGFLLAVHLDALFDQGFMTFGDDGVAQFSPGLSEKARSVVAGADPPRLSRVTNAHTTYLEHHRQHVFRTL